MIIEISIAVIAVAFVVLVIYLIILMSEVKNNLRRVRKILGNTDDISLDLRNKMDALNPFFQTLANLGEITEKETTSLKNRLSTPLEEKAASPRSDDDFTQDVLEFAGSGIRLLKNLKRRR